MKELNEMELKEVEGGIFPIVIFGVVISAQTAAWIVAGCIFAAGVYMGYKAAAEADKANAPVAGDFQGC